MRLGGKWEQSVPDPGGRDTSGIRTIAVFKGL